MNSEAEELFVEAFSELCRGAQKEINDYRNAQYELAKNFHAKFEFAEGETNLHTKYEAWRAEHGANQAAFLRQVGDQAPKTSRNRLRRGRKLAEISSNAPEMSLLMRLSHHSHQKCTESSVEPRRMLSLAQSYCSGFSKIAHDLQACYDESLPSSKRKRINECSIESVEYKEQDTDLRQRPQGSQSPKGSQSPRGSTKPSTKLLQETQLPLEAYPLLPILRHCTLLGDPLRKSWLLAAGTKRKRWSVTGELEEFYITHLKLNPNLADMLRAPVKLENMLNVLEGAGFIEKYPIEGPDQLLRCSEEPELAFFHSDTWHQTMRLACFLLAESEYSESGSRECAIQILPLFQKLLESKNEIQRDIVPVISSALLESSKYSDIEWKLRAIDEVKSLGLESLSVEQRAYFMYRKSVILRSKGRSEEARRTIDAYLSTKLTAKPTSQLYAIHGLIRDSLAWIYIDREEFQKGIEIINDWTPNHEVSLYEIRVQQKHETTKGIANKCLGNLEGAIVHLRRAQNVYDYDSLARLQASANLSDAYYKIGNLEKTYEVLQNEFLCLYLATAGSCQSSYGLGNWNIKQFLISSAEIYMRMSKHDLADKVLKHLLEYFENIQVKGLDQKRYMRTILLYAQVKHKEACTNSDAQPGTWDSSIRAWNKLIEVIQEYNAIERYHSDYALICLSVYHAQRCSYGDRANEGWYQMGISYAQNGGNFRMPSMLYWRDYLLKQSFGMPVDTNDRIRMLGA